MKKIFFLLIVYISQLQLTIASSDTDLGIVGEGCLTKENVRNGAIHIENIPCMIRSMIDFLLGLSGTIAVIFVIIGAYKILFGGFQQDTTKGKDTIIMALTGFAIASLAWFIIKLLIDNLS